MKNQWKYFFVCVVFILPVHSQFIVKGEINNTAGDAIANANVVCKISSDGIIAYTYTDAEGNFILNIGREGEFVLEFSSLGYKKKHETIILTAQKTKELYLRVVLQKSTVALDEVILIENRPIAIRKDTIVIDPEAFARGNEEVVEDILKGLPNVSVDEDGIIRVGNTEIEKIMIEGDDFFNRGYQMISKNMPSQPIARIQVINNYLENELLKHVRQSDKIAINLKLKEAAKRIWFGNAELTHGITTADGYELSMTAMNFGKKNKYYTHSNYNDIGRDVKGYANGLLDPIKADDLATPGAEQAAFQLLEFSPAPLNFRKERNNFNNSELVSFNAILNPANGFKIGTNGLLNWDENGFINSIKEIVNLPETSFTNIENRAAVNKLKLGFIKIDLDLSLSETSTIKSSTRLRRTANITRSNLIFNANSSLELLDTDESMLDQTLCYTKKINEKKAVIIKGIYVYDKIPQRYAVDNLSYPGLFPLTNNPVSLTQNSENVMQVAAVDARFISKQGSGHLMEIHMGDLFRKDILRSGLFLSEGNEALAMPAGFQNNLEFATNDLYLKTKYNRKGAQLGFTVGLELHQLHNRIINVTTLTTDTSVYVNPSFGLEWSLNSRSKLKASASFNTANTGILEVFKNYAITGPRLFTRGTAAFDLLPVSNVLMSYKFGNWSDKFFVNTVLFYQRKHKYYSSNSVIEPNYTSSERLLLKDRDLFNLNAKIDYYFRSLASNVKLDLGYSRLDYRNVVNNSEIRKVLSVSYNYGLQFRTGFKGNFNFHSGTKWTSNKIMTLDAGNFTDNLSFLDLTFSPGDKMHMQMEAERYFFGKLKKRNNTYYFLDFSIRFEVAENKIEIGMIGKNLFNTRTYRNFALSDVGNTVSEFRLLPRFLLLKLKFRF